MDEREGLRTAARVDLLLRTAPFSAFTPEQVTRIAQASHEVVLRKGEALWRRGQVAHRLGVLLAGRLKLRRSQGVREVIVDVCGPGRVLGELTLSSGEPYQSDAVCLRRARVLAIPADGVRTLLYENPRAAMALAMDLAAQNVRLLRVVEDLCAGTVAQRLARVLVRLAETDGEPFPGGTLIPMRLRRADLAAIAATTVESTSRTISDWHRRGWVIPQPAGYLVRDAGELRAVIDGADPTRH